MKRTFALSTALMVALTACGGDEPAEDMDAGMEAEAPAAEQPAESGGDMGGLQMPDWYQYDEAANTVTLDLIAGETQEYNSWNFNGYANGDITVVVPTGAQVTINFSNQDPNMGHSVGVAAFSSNPPGSLPADPVFEGAITSNATSLMESTMQGESETITFTAGQAGEYSLACYVPGHAVAGMWIGFTVSDSGEAGVEGAL